MVAHNQFLGGLHATTVGFNVGQRDTKVARMWVGGLERDDWSPAGRQELVELAFPGVATIEEVSRGLLRVLLVK